MADRDSRAGRHARRGSFVVGAVVALAAPLAAADPSAQGAGGLPELDAGSVPTAVRLLAVVTILGVVPSIILLATSFPRILIVLSFLRRALGTQELPPQSVISGLALLLSILVMLPVAQRVHEEAYAPLQDGRVTSVEEALRLAERPLKDFMLRHTLRSDLLLMVDLAKRNGGMLGGSPPGSVGATRLEARDLPFPVVLPAFVLSELKVAFQMGFLILLPFLVIDLAVSAVLLSMGMFMLPPVLVSLPLKVLVFVLVDGWHLVVGQLVRGFV